MVTSEPVVVHGLEKRYGGRAVVAGIDFRVRRGEVLALLGPNGAGKTTTVEILEGYRRRSGGDVRVLGEDPREAGPAWRERVGIVLQTTGFATQAGVRELVAHMAHFYPHPRDVDRTLAAVGLARQAGARIASLSGGQKRRLDVALGVVGCPELLFLDEPTTGFDPEARHEFWGLIEGLRAEGTTILLTTHYLDEAARLSDRAIVLVEGRVMAEGPVGELGGPGARRTHVRWRDAAGAHEEVTDRPAELVARLHADLGEPRDLEVRTPSLEDVYLDMLESGRPGEVAR